MERIGLVPGSEVGGYRVVAPLGSGGMGTVYRAVDGGGAVVALKLLHPHVGADPVARDRLRREVVALQRLRHRGVAAVLDAEADSTEAFIVTELVPGRNLEEHVRAHGSLDADALLELATGLREALDAVHGAGVVHRDLKPTNVLVTPDGPVLIDFGIAQAADDVRVTSVGFVVGTPGYLAPEMLDGAEASAASDWWGWAAVLTFAATGRAPFGTGPIEAVLARARSGEPDVAGLGPVTAAALRGALAAAAAARMPAPDVVEALARAARDGDEPVGEDAVATAVHRVEPTTATAGTVAVAAATSPSPALASTAVLGPEQTAASPSPALASTAVLGAAGGTATAVLPQDGITRTFPAPGGPAGAEAPGSWPAPDDVESDWPDEDDAGDGEPYDGGPYDGELDDDGVGYVAPVPRRRYGSLLALGLLVVVAGALFPGVTLVVLVLLLVLARTVGSAADALHRRRERLGVRRSDGLRTAVATPWHLLRGAVGLLPSLIVGASAGVIVAGVLWWGLASGRWPSPLLGPDGEPGPWLLPAVVGVAILVALLTTWWGPASATTRDGARRTLAALAPGRTGAVVLVLLALAGVVVLAVLLAGGQDPAWMPLPEPTLPS